VTIKNYRSIKELDFEVGDLCALIGPNNTGKSNILKAIDLVLGETWPTIRSVEPGDFYAYSEDDMVITVWFDEPGQVSGDVGDTKDYWGIQLTIDRYKRKTGNKERGDLRSKFVCVDAEGNPVYILKRPNRKAKPYQAPATVSTDVRDRLPVVFIDIDRNARYHLSGSSRSVFGRMLADIAKELRKDSKRFAQFQEKFEEARKLLRTERFEALERNLADHLKRHTGLPELSLQLDGLDPINLYKNFSVLFKDPDTPEMVDFERMGSGVQSALVMSLLQVYREMKKENAVLLFEEPELYLHPHGRRHLFRLLKELSEGGVQIIYTTHSQDFVDLTALDSVRLVYRSRDEGTKVMSPDLSKVSGDWKTRVKHLSEPKNEVFFAKKVIVVEGPTERLAIRRLASMMKQPLDLDLHDCSVVEASKTAIPTLVRILAALDKPVMVVYDTDSDKTDPADVSTNEKREMEIQEAVDAHGQVTLFPCDPCLEVVAGIADARKSNKPEQMMEHLDVAGNWKSISSGLKKLMKKVATFATTI